MEPREVVVAARRESVVCDKGHVGRSEDGWPAPAGATSPRGSRPHLGRIRQRIESVFQTFKDILTLERHGARTPEGLRARIGVRLLALAPTVWLKARGINHLAAEWDAERCVHGIEGPHAEAEHRRDNGG